MVKWSVLYYFLIPKNHFSVACILYTPYLVSNTILGPLSLYFSLLASCADPEEGGGGG